jgi:hypothetical protein
MIDIEFGGNHHALLQPGTQAGGDIDIDLKVFHVREGQQRLARLGGIADLHGFLDDDAIERARCCGRRAAWNPGPANRPVRT